MLPDFLNAKQKIHDHLMAFFDDRVAHHSGGFLKQIPKRPLHEGSGFITKYEDGMTDDSPLTPIRASFDFTAEELLSNPDEIYKKLDKMAHDVAFQESKMILDKISELTEKIGNVTKTRGEVTPEDVFDMFDKIEIDFNSDGTARMPTIWAGDLMMRSLPSVFEKIKNDPALTRRFETLMNGQKSRWYDRQANRKLVD